MAPFLPQRDAQPLDVLEAGVAGGGWEELERLLTPQAGSKPLQPDDEVARFMWGLYCTAQGREMFEWMMDISLRQPLRITGQTLEQTALLSASRQGINGFAEAVLAAVGHGRSLVMKRQNGAGE